MLVREGANQQTAHRVPGQDVGSVNMGVHKQGVQVASHVLVGPRRGDFVAAPEIGPVVRADAGGPRNAVHDLGPVAGVDPAAGFQDQRRAALASARVEQLMPANVNLSGNHSGRSRCCCCGIFLAREHKSAFNPGLGERTGDGAVRLERAIQNRQIGSLKQFEVHLREFQPDIVQGQIDGALFGYVHRGYDVAVYGRDLHNDLKLLARDGDRAVPGAIQLWRDGAWPDGFRGRRGAGRRQEGDRESAHREMQGTMFHRTLPSGGCAGP